MTYCCVLLPRRATPEGCILPVTKERGTFFTAKSELQDDSFLNHAWNIHSWIWHEIPEWFCTRRFSPAAGELTSRSWVLRKSSWEFVHWIWAVLEFRYRYSSGIPYDFEQNSVGHLESRSFFSWLTEIITIRVLSGVHGTTRKLSKTNVVGGERSPCTHYTPTRQERESRLY